MKVWSYLLQASSKVDIVVPPGYTRIKGIRAYRHTDIRAYGRKSSGDTSYQRAEKLWGYILSKGRKAPGIHPIKGAERRLGYILSKGGKALGIHPIKGRKSSGDTSYQRAYGHTDIRTYGNTDIRTYGHTDIRTCGLTGIQRYRHTDILLFHDFPNVQRY